METIVTNPVEHLGLVRKIAFKLAHRPFVPKLGQVPLEDTDEYAEGCVGLIEAARRFDASRGFKFSTFACNYIRGYILSWKNGLRKDAKRDMSRHDDRRMMPFSVLGSMYENSDDAIELICARGFLNEDLELSETSDWIGWALSHVKESRVRAMVVKYVLFGMTFDLVSKEHGISKERVRQLVERGLEQIHHAFVKAGVKRSDFDKRAGFRPRLKKTG